MRWLLKTAARGKGRRSDEPVAPRSGRHLSGNIDDAESDGKIWGWAALRDPEIKSADVMISFEGHKGIPCEAEIFREDLLAAGFGDGRHGFIAQLPRALLAAADSVRLVGQADGGEEVLTVRSLAGVDQRTRPVVVFLEFSDLIVYLTNHRNLSGIQRTQCGFILHLMNKRHAGFEYRLCCRDEGDLKFREVSEASLKALLAAAFDADSVTQAQWPHHCKTFWARSASPIVCRDGDVLLTLGAPWAVGDHHLALSALKRQRSIRYFQILYDLIPLTAPEYVHPPLIPVFADAIAGMLIHAEHVFSISRFTSEELALFGETHGIRCPPVSVVTMGGTIDDAIGRRLPRPAEPSIRGFRPREQDFVLFVGTLEPRKNHQLVVNIWKKLIATHGIDKVPKLVLVGRIGWSIETLERQLRMSHHLDGAIVHLTKVSDSDLQILFETCMFTLFPSLYEGWGLPIVESLSYGKICVSSDTTSMKEAGGDSAVYVDPLDFTGAYATVEELIYDRDLLRRKTLDLERDYRPVTWEDAAADLDGKIVQAITLAGPDARGDSSPVGALSLGKLYDLSAPRGSPTGHEAFTAADRKLRLLAVLADGEWYDPDGWGCWCCSPEPVLRFLVDDEPGHDLVAYLRLRLWRAKPGHTVQVLVDDAPEGHLAFDDAGYCHCRIWIPAATRSGPRTITFKIDREHPIWLGVHAGSENFKAVGLGLSSLYLCRDVAEDRLRYLESSLSVPSP